MPEHIHVLISEPKRDTVSVVVQVLKQRAAHRLLQKSKPRLQRELWRTMRPRFWQRRYYDFNVYSDGKVTEKLRYMHRNPVERGLVPSPELWRWSSYRAFAFCEEGVVKLNWQRRFTNGKAKAVAASGAADSIAAHLRKSRRVGHPLYGFVNEKQDEGRGTRLSRAQRLATHSRWRQSAFHHHKLLPARADANQLIDHRRVPGS